MRCSSQLLCFRRAELFSQLAERESRATGSCTRAHAPGRARRCWDLLNANSHPQNLSGARRAPAANSRALSSSRARAGPSSRARRPRRARALLHVVVRRHGRGRGINLKPRHVCVPSARPLRTDEVAADTHGRCRESSGSCSRQRAVRRDVQRAAPPGVLHTGARRRVKRSDGLSAMECRGHLKSLSRLRATSC